MPQQNFQGTIKNDFQAGTSKLRLAQKGKLKYHFSMYLVRPCMCWDVSDLQNPNTLFFSHHTANSVLIFTTELMSIKRKSLFDPKLLLQIGFWPILAGMILYYLYRKASKESAKAEAKSSKKNKKK